MARYSHGGRRAVEKTEATIPASRGALSGWDGLARVCEPNPRTPSIRRAYRRQAAALTSIFGSVGSWESDREPVRVNLQAFKEQSSCQTRCGTLSVGSLPSSL